MEKYDQCNYRPISILPTISKIFERHVNRHLMSYLNKNCLIHETQSGFRQKHSCQTALVKLIDQWMACIDKGDIVGSIFIDFRKAFDLVDHKTLIRKLSTYKCSQSSLQWFISYLESRQQTIDYGHGTSLLSFIKSGGGIILYFRKSINYKRRCAIEASNIETLWVEISLPNAKPFLICTVYRPPSSNSEWIDQFEEELSIAQAYVM